MISKFPIKNENIASRIIEGQAVILSLGDNTLHTLNSVGSRIWELCDGQRSVGEIITIINEEYLTCSEETQADCEAFFQDLSQKGIMRLQDERSIGEKGE